MADEKRGEKDKAKKPATKKPAAKKQPAKKAPAKKAPAKKPAAKTPAAKSGAEKAEPKAKAPTEGKPKAETKAKADTKPKRSAANKDAQRPVVNARARFVRIAPRKARLVADQVRGLPIEDARALLRFSPRGAARDIVKLIDSAAANAEANHDLIADDLRVAEIYVDEGPTLKRWRARARGRAARIEKKTSHLSVALTPTTD